MHGGFSTSMSAFTGGCIYVYMCYGSNHAVRTTRSWDTPCDYGYVYTVYIYMKLHIYIYICMNVYKYIYIYIHYVLLY